MADEETKERGWIPPRWGNKMNSPEPEEAEEAKPAKAAPKKKGLFKKKK